MKWLIATYDKRHKAKGARQRTESKGNSGLEDRGSRLEAEEQREKIPRI
jgi:hypothetical protein